MKLAWTGKHTESIALDLHALINFTPFYFEIDSHVVSQGDFELCMSTRTSDLPASHLLSAGMCGT